jgi:hypothetical protein
MIALFHSLAEALRPGRPARRLSLVPSVDSLDQRALLSAGVSHALAVHAREVARPHDVERNGIVVKTPRFYEDYVGSRIAELDAVKASGQLLRSGSFKFVGVNLGTIDPNIRATYVFGVDRSGKLLAGPFPGRPDIRFDATLVIKIVPGKATTVTV